MIVSQDLYMVNFTCYRFCALCARASMYLEEVQSDRWMKTGKDHRHEETKHA